MVNPQSTQASQPSGGQYNTNTNPGAGLFGSQQQQQSNANNLFNTNNTQQGGGMFGSTLNQNANQAGSSLFANSSSNQGGLFGSTHGTVQPQMSQNAPPSIFSTRIGQQSQQQTVPGVRISINELRSTTRFNDLHEELQKTIEFVDAFVINKIQWQEQCEAAGPLLEDMCQQMPPDVEYCTKNLDTVQQVLENDAQSIATAKHVVRGDAQDAKLSFKVIQNLKLPQQFHQTNVWSMASVPEQANAVFSDEALDDGSSRSLVDYFSKQADDMAQSLAAYKRNVAEIELYLKEMEANASRQVRQLGSGTSRNGSMRNAEDQVRELAAVLRQFENGILGIATKVGAAREQAQDAMLDQVRTHTALHQKDRD